jgi:hypothetical protein
MIRFNNILSLCFTALVTLSPINANAELSLAADLVAGAESSSASPVGRISAGLLIVAKNATGKTDLLIAREPSGTIEKITTLVQGQKTVSSVSEGAFFTIPASLQDGGTHWYTDGTAEGTVSVPFSKAAIFQRNGEEVIYRHTDSTYNLGRYNLARGLNEENYINGGSIQVHAIIGGIPVGISSGYIYTWSFKTKQWQTLDQLDSIIRTYTGSNRDMLYVAKLEESTYRIGIYQIIPDSLFPIQFRSTLFSVEESTAVDLSLMRENGVDYVAFTLKQGGAVDYYIIERHIESADSSDTLWSSGGVISTRRGDLTFLIRSGLLYSETSNKGLLHQPLTWQQETIQASALRIVGDTLLVFGSSGSRGAEVWSTPVDACPNDSAKLYGGACGCGIADTDSDLDRTPDCLDACPLDHTKIAQGACGCGKPDVDPDGDGTMSCVDLCPQDPHKIIPGACGCGKADTDTDGDGTPNCNDSCATDAAKTAPGVCGCGSVDSDTDNDGFMDCVDQCPSSALKRVAGACGCNVPDTDTDKDGTPDCIDTCVNDPRKIGPGSCGCGNSDIDSDGDTLADCLDQCPSDPKKHRPGLAGCGLSEKDTDGDGAPDDIEQCPTDFTKKSPGTCGCNIADNDRDGDGHADCVDECSADKLKHKTGICGCGVADTDSDRDGKADCFDLCPNEPTLTQPIAGSCQRIAAVADLCPLDAAKLSPGVCGCGFFDTDANANGTPDCIENQQIALTAPNVRAQTSGKSALLRVVMTTVRDAAYVVELTRLDKKNIKPIVKSYRTSSVVIKKITRKTRWSVRYRVATITNTSDWSAATKVGVK